MSIPAASAAICVIITNLVLIQFEVNIHVQAFSAGGAAFVGHTLGTYLQRWISRHSENSSAQNEQEP